jgi:hypothetical protein
MFDGRKSTFVKSASILLAGSFAITGLAGLGAISIGTAKVCHGDFIIICSPIEAPGTALLAVVIGAMAAFLLYARSKFTEGKIER